MYRYFSHTRPSLRITRIAAAARIHNEHGSGGGEGRRGVPSMAWYLVDRRGCLPGAYMPCLKLVSGTSGAALPQQN
ncbi:hypothetical protein HYQ46_010100 [Verticillium longisporum]|nr:hypothetical protein HYQ46_010100 [Verticillium longisporum]